MSETATRDRFQPERYRRQLSAIAAACAAADPLDDAELQRILRRHPKDGDGFFSRSELIAGVRFLASTDSRAEPLFELLRCLRDAARTSTPNFQLPTPKLTTEPLGVGDWELGVNGSCKLGGTGD